MNFAWAVEQLLLGKSVRLRKWPLDMSIKVYYEHVFCFYKDEVKFTWSPTKDSLKSEDWEVAA